MCIGNSTFSDKIASLPCRYVQGWHLRNLELYYNTQMVLNNPTPKVPYREEKFQLRQDLNPGHPARKPMTLSEYKIWERVFGSNTLIDLGGAPHSGALSCHPQCSLPTQRSQLATQSSVLPQWDTRSMHRHRTSPKGLRSRNGITFITWPLYSMREKVKVRENIFRTGPSCNRSGHWTPENIHEISAFKSPVSYVERG